jgi:hypothetical protein
LYKKGVSTLGVANEMDWPPFDFVVEGQAKDYSIDLIKLIGKNRPDF